MLRDGGEQLHVGEALLDDVLGQLVGEFEVRQAGGAPRHQVHLEGAHRFEDRVLDGPLGHPVGVLPRVLALGHPGGALGRHLGGERHRVGTLGGDAVGAMHPELVQPVCREVRPEQFPHPPGGAQGPHGGVVAAPVVEVADQADSLGIWCPHGEGHAGDGAVGRAVGARMRAQRLPKSLVATLGEQVHVDLAEGRQESVGSATV